MLNKPIKIRNITLKSNNRFINRELSWLSFNERVLNEANNSKNPLMERLRFLSISGNNLDEFHMIRVAGITRQVLAKIKTTSADGRTPQQQITDVRRSLKQILFNQQIMWSRLKKELNENGIKVITTKSKFKDFKINISEIFDKKIFSTLTPLAVDPAHPFPFLPNLSITIICSLKNKKNKSLTALVILPPNLQRFFQIGEETNIYIKTEDIILQNIQKLFPEFKLQEFTLIRVIRDSDLEIEDEAEDLMSSFELALKKRRLGSVIGLYTLEGISKKLLRFIKKQLNLMESNLFKVTSILDIESLGEIITYSKPELLFENFEPRFPQRIRDHGGDCFAAIKKKELIVHHPFESFDVVVSFLSQAAHDPKVVSIKQTLYRTSSNSPIVEALINAANNGKSVTAIVELKARFDEEKNIKWAKDLEKAGVQIVYGFMKWKTHAKISLVSRKEENKIINYVHFGTGNYHPITAKFYTDLSYFSSNQELCNDAGKIFNFITGYSNPERMNLISFSPNTFRKNIIKLIQNEILNIKNNKPAEIWIKVNSLIDPEIIDELYKASIAGVKIFLIVRGICGLRPGIDDLSSNIIVKSIIGRFLEHSRIYAFSNGYKMPSRNSKVFISSADLMTRNLDRRVETFIPIINETVHEQVLEQILENYLKDNSLSWLLRSDGTYKKLKNNLKLFSVHNFFMNNNSLSGRGSSSKK